MAGVLSLLLARAPWDEKLGRLDAAALGSLCALLLAAPHWLIFLDALGRAATLYDQPKVIFAREPHAIAFTLGALSPGTPETGVHPFAMLAAVLPLASPASSLRSGAAIGAFMTVAIFGAAAFGVVPASWLMTLPLVGGIHHIGNSFLTATITPLFLLSGLGVAGQLNGRGNTPGALLLLAGGVIVLILGITGAGREFGPTMAALSIVLAAAALGSAISIRTPAAASVVATATCVYLSVAAGGLHFRTGIAQADALLIQPPARATLEALSPALEAIRARAGSEPSRVAPIEEVLFPGTQALWRLESTGGPDALKLPAMDTLSDLTGVERTSWFWRTALHPGATESARGFLDMTNVAYLVARGDQVPRGIRPLPLNGPDQLVVALRETAWPRAFFVDGVERHDSTAALANRIRGATGPFASVAHYDADAVRGLPQSASHASPADSYRLTPNTTTFTVRSEGPGLAVLSEAFVELDFEATLNGKATSYLQVNHALKGVLIPGPGRWTVQFLYRPRLWNVSWLLAALGLLGLTGLAMADPLLSRGSKALQ
jgi:hypothetical protein